MCEIYCEHKVGFFMLIKNGTVHDAVNRESYIADILIADRKIKAIGENGALAAIVIMNIPAM